VLGLLCNEGVYSLAARDCRKDPEILILLPKEKQGIWECYWPQAEKKSNKNRLGEVNHQTNIVLAATVGWWWKDDGEKVPGTGCQKPSVCVVK
jgi:hypothetical protein